ncbi:MULTISPECIES: M50 family metallopeptidase [unclassified Frankia]|uniref:M50 family metallopeptidase n=1 Tax=unclassified Frankia TaxID=2632575 RepID=UPI001EF5D550|nr:MULTISPECIES: M50 family metallopeptidase [unclassified Frankia]
MNNGSSSMGLTMIVADRVGTPLWIIVLTGLAALAAVVPTWTWHGSGHLDTIAHEGGHALVAYLLGRWVLGVWLFSDTSGLTSTYGRRNRFAEFLMLAAGYTASSGLGLGAAALLNAGHITATLLLALLALAALFLVTRNGFGKMIVAGTGTVVILVLHSASVGTQSALACFLTWFLLLAGPRSVLDLHRAHRKGAWSSDADAMAEITGIPAIIWIADFGVFTVLCLFRGTYLFLG